MSEGGKQGEGDVYIGNIWGRKWTIIALIFILFVIGIGVCRYVVIQPEQLIIPEEIEDFG